VSRTLKCLTVLIACFPLALVAQSGPETKSGSQSLNLPSASPTSPPETIQTRVEQYLRNLYAWDSSFKITVGSTKPSPVPDLLKVLVTVSQNGHSDSANVYVSKDGQFLFRGEVADMSLDPLAETRAMLHPGTSPSKGPENAKITLVEFADFECPSCRQLDLILRDVLAKHPEIRLVYKDFPLTDIHPWAMTAALAGQCAHQQNEKAFWRLHDSIFDDQDIISASNVWDKMNDYAAKIGLNDETFRACMASPGASQKVQQSIAEGHALNLNSTPTIFVNGRRIAGADQILLEQDIKYETAK
jgi:protein-disulfide isomerase